MVDAAAELQNAVAARNAGLPEPEHIVFRVGINLGDVALVDADVYGDGVNVAARLEQLAEPGGVVVSGTAYDHLQGKIDWSLDFAGEQQVKNISRPVRMYRLRLDGRQARRSLLELIPRWGKMTTASIAALALAVGGVWWFLLPEPLSGKPSVAVLPFDNYAIHLSSHWISRSTVPPWPIRFPTIRTRFPISSRQCSVTTPIRTLGRWARQFVRYGQPTETGHLLMTLCYAVRESFSYARRLEHGTQTPVQTLSLRSGSCRDFALLMMEAAR
ncbi:transglutaminase superfamily protein [Rhizobium sp. BK251]|nr:transglutaminase superfamily protein [Rhizobium sp. BK251]